MFKQRVDYCNEQINESHIRTDGFVGSFSRDREQVRNDLYVAGFIRPLSSHLELAQIKRLAEPRFDYQLKGFLQVAAIDLQINRENNENYLLCRYFQFDSNPLEKFKFLACAFEEDNVNRSREIICREWKKYLRACK